MDIVMIDKQRVLIDETAIRLFEMRVDELVEDKNVEGTKEFIATFDEFTRVFDDLLLEARFYYLMGNAYYLLYVPQDHEWYDQNLSIVVVCFRKALTLLEQRGVYDDAYRFYRGCIETNLGNYLSQQGRCFCAKKHWSNAISVNNEPVAFTANAQSELYLAELNLKDVGKRHYHYYLAYKSIIARLELPNHEAYPDSPFVFDNGSNLQQFKKWFEDEFNLEDFEGFFLQDDKVKTRKEQEYLDWCRENRLFLSDIDDVDLGTIVHPDIVAMPDFIDKVNTLLSYHEDYVYHSNFDEIKNDYCYARYLIFSSINIPNEQSHFNNRTFAKVDDLTCTIDNLKAQNLKSAFRTLYAIFDKIAYFISRFFDLNDIDKDHLVCFESLFKQSNTGNRGKEWKPHPKLKDSGNSFIHALFYILKDLRDLNDENSPSHWLNHDLEKIWKIRNFIEHRSFKLIDSTYSDLIFSSSLEDYQAEQLDREEQELKTKLKTVYQKMKALKNHPDTQRKVELEIKKSRLAARLKNIEDMRKDKVKRSGHTMMMTDTNFIRQLMTLTELIRNSIMYLSFSVIYENQLKVDTDDRVFLSREVPTKSE